MATLLKHRENPAGTADEVVPGPSAALDNGTSLCGEAKPQGLFEPAVWRNRLSHWLRNVSSLVVGRVSRIHYLEAKERYYNLLSLAELNYELIRDMPDVPEEHERRIAVLQCCRILRKAEDLLTYRQQDLNNLWRALTRVRVILFEKVLDDDSWSTQVDFCREEAHRLAVEDRPEVREMLQQLAEATDEDGNNRDNRKVRRLTHALVERFNTIRTGRIYNQFIKMRTYRAAFWVLMFLALVLVGNAGLLVENAEITFPSYQPLIELSTLPPDSDQWYHQLKKLVVYHAHYINELMNGNVLVFVFLSGLVGGMFSVVMRVKQSDLKPGEDAYFRYYVLTKPYVGALGAVILFILFQGEFMAMDLVKDLGSKASAKVFGFVFLSGFSERFVFPQLH